MSQPPAKRPIDDCMLTQSSFIPTDETPREGGTNTDRTRSTTPPELRQLPCRYAKQGCSRIFGRPKDEGMHVGHCPYRFPSTVSNGRTVFDAKTNRTNPNQRQATSAAISSSSPGKLYSLLTFLIFHLYYYGIDPLTLLRPHCP